MSGEIDEALTRFREDAAAVVRAEGGSAAGRRRIAALLAALGASWRERDVALESLHSSGASATLLFTGPGGTLMLARFPETAPTPVHDHKSWGVAYVLRGRDRHVHWKRTDDGGAPGRATLAADDDRVLAAGDSVSWGEPPDDIHSQQGVGGPAWELVFFGHNPMAVMRRYFDVAAGTYREAMP